MKKLRAAIIANAHELGIVRVINEAVAAVPDLAAKAGDVPQVLREITLDQLVSGAASKVPLDRDILAALRAASAEEFAENGDPHVRAVHVAKRLDVTTSAIRGRLSHLAKVGNITSIGRAAGKRYAPVESEVRSLGE